jgi:carbohydrate binding protein with CBM19 domain
MTEPDEDNQVIEDVAPGTAGVEEGQSCGPDQVDICWDDSSYATCTNGSWIIRPCASGTTCQDSDGHVFCGFSD